MATTSCASGVVLSLRDNSSVNFWSARRSTYWPKAFTADGWSLRRASASARTRSFAPRSGSGEVWRARDERLGRDVAIKVLLPHYSRDAERLRRFGEEARRQARSITPTFSPSTTSASTRARRFSCRNAWKEESLRKRLDAGPLPRPETLDVALGVARGLAAAHAPRHHPPGPQARQHVYLRHGGAVKILDFGLAKLESSLGRFQDQKAANNDRRHHRYSRVYGARASARRRGATPSRRSLFCTRRDAVQNARGARAFQAPHLGH